MAAVVLALILGAGAWLAMARAENSSASILPAGASAAGGAPVHPRSPITAGHLLFPVAGMHALQEVDPVTHSVIQTIPLPDGYSYGDPQMQVTTLVRRSDRSILTNARDRSGRPTLLVLSDRGELVHAQTVPSSFPAPRQYLQQIQFDASDPTQSIVLGGTPLTPTVVALNPFGGTVVTKITEANANFIGLQTDRQGRLYVANWSNGQVTRFVNSGSGGQLTQESLFADVRSDTGTSEVNGLAVDDDALYIAQCATRRVLKYVQSAGPDRRTSGTLSTSLADPDFTYPCSVSVHPATGRLYVGNQDSRTVVVFERDGTRVGTLMLGGSHPGLATVVPD
jgi:DNA-binding beta-propeller fold protein YncE